MSDLIIERVDPSSSTALQALRAYYDDIVSRYYQRPISREELDAVMREESSDDLIPPGGVLLVARQGGEVLGCAGLRISSDVGEVTRVHVTASARGRGLGSRLLVEVEDVARLQGLLLLRLDTRSDLVEARRLYARHGYQEVERFNTSPYAEHWFAKVLTPLPCDATALAPTADDPLAEAHDTNIRL
ncbi:GNAT family N-acetyltransferase [Kineococcus xinjiangensis]|uniref:GNAT family N-acetyltransferase n=1 Tax=Kineococcus xinjiangensis TaxID=512762 RepID=UPI001B806A98|nr:GNAT family N-acetyltransferase [Kineococcus xinjiangensis]